VLCSFVEGHLGHDLVEDFPVIEVEDDVSADFLFADEVGQAGLGLYFRNIMIPRWGGKIGYRRTRQSRSQFWFSSPVPAR
jgi:hypothetical protein